MATFSTEAVSQGFRNAVVATVRAIANDKLMDNYVNVQLRRTRSLRVVSNRNLKRETLGIPPPLHRRVLADSKGSLIVEYSIVIIVEGGARANDTMLVLGQALVAQAQSTDGRFTDRLRTEHADLSQATSMFADVVYTKIFAITPGPTLFPTIIATQRSTDPPTKPNWTMFILLGSTAVVMLITLAACMCWIRRCLRKRMLARLFQSLDDGNDRHPYENYAFTPAHRRMDVMERNAMLVREAVATLAQL